MARAQVLVEAYVAAGFAKIHLDCSMSCAGDLERLDDAVVASRAARLARVAEDAASAAGRPGAVVYVIGTEVPVPGGAHESITALTPTSAQAARVTLAAHRAAFHDAGVDSAFDRVLGLVVQPGVEFDHLQVVGYDHSRTAALRGVTGEHPHLVFEAHSTDYQSVAALTELVQDHWAILKVGPGLSFALREALMGLAAIEDVLIPADRRSRLFEVVESAMLTEPRWWQGYYPGEAAAQQLARRFSYSDRIRYYWPRPEVRDAERRLFDNLTEIDLPLPLLSQYLPDQYTRIRNGTLAAEPRALVLDRVRDVLRGYARACAPDVVRRSLS